MDRLQLDQDAGPKGRLASLSTRRSPKRWKAWASGLWRDSRIGPSSSTQLSCHCFAAASRRMIRRESDSPSSSCWRNLTYLDSSTSKERLTFHTWRTWPRTNKLSAKSSPRSLTITTCHRRIPPTMTTTISYGTGQMRGISNSCWQTVRLIPRGS